MRPALAAYINSDEATLHAAAVRNNGGWISDARVALNRRLIQASKACGHWYAVDDVALLTAENAIQGRVTWKGRRLMTPVNGPTFTVDRGYATDGLSSYINTNWNPVAHARAMKGTDVRVAAYETVNLAAAAVVMGCTEAGVATISFRPRSASTTMLGALASGTTTLTIAADSRGLKVLSRAGGTTTANGWDRGVSQGTATTTTAVNVLPNASIFIGARNNAGSPDQMRATTVAVVEWGASLPGGTTAELAWYTALQAYLTAIGAAV